MCANQEKKIQRNRKMCANQEKKYKEISTRSEKMHKEEKELKEELNQQIQSVPRMKTLIQFCSDTMLKLRIQAQEGLAMEESMQRREGKHAERK